MCCVSRSPIAISVPPTLRRSISNNSAAGPFNGSKPSATPSPYRLDNRRCLPKRVTYLLACLLVHSSSSLLVLLFCLFSSLLILQAFFAGIPNGHPKPFSHTPAVIPIERAKVRFNPQRASQAI